MSAYFSPKTMDFRVHYFGHSGAQWITYPRIYAPK